MARIRTIKPEYWTSVQIVECSLLARLMFIGIWNFADDHGVFPASAKLIKMQVFPADDLTFGQIDDCLVELERAGLIHRYADGGKEYLMVTGWSRHQRIERPSYKYPLPPSDAASGERSAAGQDAVPAQPSDTLQIDRPDPDAASGTVRSRAPIAHVGGQSPRVQQSSSEHSESDRRTVSDGSSIDQGPLAPGKEGKGEYGSPPLNPPLEIPAGAIDRVRKVVWGKAGLSDQQIEAMLASTDAGGLRQVRRWFDIGLSESQIISEIGRAFDTASEPIRYPWKYLDTVMTSATERPAANADCSAGGFVSSGVDWRHRFQVNQDTGFWSDSWGDRPDTPGYRPPSDVPADVLAEFGYGG